MRYSPYYNTFSTKRFPFVGNPEQRLGSSANKDQLYINFFASEYKTYEGPKFMLEQRAGLVYQQGTVAGEGRGIYYWNGITYYVVGNTLYSNGTALQVLSTSTGPVGFQEFGNDTNQIFLIVLDGTSGWVINSSNSISKITDANFPTPHTVQSAYLDGYLVVAKANTGDLYNCNVNDPTTWTAGNFISAEANPDRVMCLTRQNNYIVALGTASIEYFYDAGNYPGTPFARNSAALHQFGISAPFSLVENEEQLMFVGQTQLGGRTVWLLDGFNPSEVANESVRRSLDSEGTNIANARAFCIRSKGHRFYVLNLTSVTWVFDFHSQMWHQWADYTGSNKFNCDFGADSGLGRPYLLDRTTGYVYVMSGDTTQDATSTTATANITCTAISDRLDFGSMNQKFMHRFSLLCDVPSSNYTATANLYWTDDDYQTYSSGRIININNSMPVITQLGMFRRRAFKLVYADSYPIRIEGFEVDINAGSQ